MRIQPSQILLVIALAVWGYWLRGEFTGSAVAAPAAPAKPRAELTANTISRPLTLACERDPFTGLPLRPLDPNRPAAIAAIKPTTRPVKDLKLQGVLLADDGARAAIINGKALPEGQLVQLEESGGNICARSIGADYAIVDAGAGLITLRLEQPDTKSSAQQPPTATARQGGQTSRPPFDLPITSLDFAK